jgi:hypothetical protein
MGQDRSEVRDIKGHALESDSPNERPTARPPFDPARFARESEMALSTGQAPESAAPTVRGPAVPRPRVSAIVSSGPELEQAVILNLRDALGGDAVPVLVASPDELGWFDLPPEAARLLALVNGVSSLDTICARANVASQDGAQTLLELAERGIVSFR